MFGVYNNNPFMNQSGIPGGTIPQGIQYVNGRASAEVFPTKPNDTVMLMDSNEDVFYIVRTDASNFKTVEEFEFHKRQEKKTSYVTQEEFDDLKKTLEDYKPLLESLKE